MKASLKLEYSLRVLSQLARRHRGTAVTRIEELAKLEDIPANYLVQLLNELREGGLVVSKRGKTGGYRLAKDAEDISLKQVLAVVEPELIETKITLKGASGPQVAALWREVSKRFDKSLTGFTVAQLALTESGNDFEICARRHSRREGTRVQGDTVTRGRHRSKGDRKPDWMLRIHFQVPGLGRRSSGSGVQVRVQVPGPKKGNPS